MSAIVYCPRSLGPAGEERGVIQEAIGVVEDGRIRLADPIEIPEGVTVKVIWNDEPGTLPPYERAEWTQEDMDHEIRWATGNRFPLR